MYKLDPEKWVTVAVASKRYNIPAGTISQWIRKGEILANMGDHGNRENVWHVSVEAMGRKLGSR
tara:strand:- start:11 stop:202 length:192 start_codon:yes stop_codon:yes gene_type:complete